jgi:hypothetical protein
MFDRSRAENWRGVKVTATRQTLTRRARHALSGAGPHIISPAAFSDAGIAKVKVVRPNKRICDVRSVQ